MSHENPVPIKPGIFNCPDGYEAMDTKESKFLSSGEDEDDYELVLIRAPHDLDFSLLNQTSFPKNKSKVVELKHDKVTYPVKMDSQPIFQENTHLGNLALMVNRDTHLVPVGKKFMHHLEITKYISVPEVTFPKSIPTDFSIPKNMRQRYTAFGSDDPVVEVDEKAVSRHKKKSKKMKGKVQPDSSVKVKRSAELEEKLKFTAQYVNQLNDSSSEEGTKKMQKKKEKSHSKTKDFEQVIKSSFSEPEEAVDIIEKKKHTPKSSSSAKRLDKKRYKDEKLNKFSKSEEAENDNSRQELIDMIMGKTPEKTKKKLKKTNISYTSSQEF